MGGIGLGRFGSGCYGSFAVATMLSRYQTSITVGRWMNGMWIGFDKYNKIDDSIVRAKLTK